MSKSLNSLVLPTAGGIALILGLGYGLSARDYGNDKIGSLQERVASMEARTAEVQAAAAASAEQAAAETARAEDLQAQVTALQAAVEAAQAAGAAAPAAMKASAPMRDGGFGLGRPAMEEEIAAWDVDVAPDGTGLPPGSGDVWTGDELFAEHCAVCHGDFAEGVDNWPKLAGGRGTLADKDPLKTVGSYWPYLSTVWDYVNRSMPFGNAQSLEPDEVYAIVAYILYSNDLVDDDFVLSDETFFDVDMPNADGFIVDDRETAEAHFWTDAPCMENCKDSVEITMRAAVLDVTPEDEGAEEEAAAPAEDMVEEAAAEEPAAEAPAEEVVALDPELVKAGERVFKKCRACHQVGEDAENKTGPVLNGIVGAPIGAVEGFRYSKTMAEMGESGATWTPEALAEFLADPRGYVKKTKMSFAGLRKDDDIVAVTEYLRSFE